MRKRSKKELAAIAMNNNKVVKNGRMLKQDLMKEEHLDEKIIREGKKERTEIKKLRKDMC